MSDNSAPFVRRKVLYIEDNPGDVRLFQEACRIQCRDLDLIIAQDGFEALKLARTEEPEIIILDLHIPPEGGFQVLRQLKASKPISLIPVLVYTGSNSRKDILEAYDNGANVVVQKGRGLDEALETVQIMCSFWLGRARLPGSGSE